MAISITIDDKVIQAEAGMTILQAARANGIRIPTLCFMEKLDPHASCRMCVVEVEGMRLPQASCVTKIRDGMVVHTNTEAIRASRKLTLEMIMAHHPVDCHHCLRLGNSKEEDLDPKFCEMCFFCDCVRDGICELQALNREYHVDKLPVDIDGYRYPVDDSLHSIIRDANKCVKCRHCVDVCNDVQTVHNLSLSGRGQEYKVVPYLNHTMKDSICVRCGRCVDACPTGALHMEESIDKMLFTTHSYKVKTVGMVSSTVLPEFEKLSKLEPGSVDIHKLIAAMKQLHVDAVISEEQVIDENMAAAEAIISGAKSRVILSNSSAVRNFVELYYKDLAGEITYFPSVQDQFKHTAEKLMAAKGCDDFKTIVFTGNNENGVDAKESGSVDFSINAREMYRIFRRSGIEVNVIRPSDAIKMDVDHTYSFAQVTKPVVFNYEKAPEVLRINGKRVAIAHNLGQVKALLDSVRDGSCPYDIIRLAA